MKCCCMSDRGSVLPRGKACCLNVLDFGSNERGRTKAANV